MVAHKTMAARTRWPLLLGGGLAAFGGGTFAALSVAGGGKAGDENGGATAPASSTPSSPPAPSIPTFDAIAPSYDARIAREEFFMGIPLLRRYTVRKARGHVLEVAAGTGRNLHYYPPTPAVASLTLADPSGAMLAVAHAKAEDRGDAASPPIALVRVSAEELTTGPGTLVPPGAARWPAPRSPPPPGRVPAGAFDTVVDTFGVCSMADPVAGLAQLGAALAPGGRLLLLEHGRSGGWAWLDARLDAGAAAHAARWGCCWNRDIRGAVAAAGLEVVSATTWHFGTTHVLECRRAGEGDRGEGGGRGGRGGGREGSSTEKDEGEK